MRVLGTEGVALIECVNPEKEKWRVRWDVQPNTGVDEQGALRIGANYEEAEYLHRPTIDEIKSVILSWHNQQIDDRIRSGFVWRDMPVWLSTENQFNYKAAYDLAVQTNGLSLPVTFKFGAESLPVYHKFLDLAEIADFYGKAMVYVNTTLAAGWADKDGIDWTPYL